MECLAPHVVHMEQLDLHAQKKFRACKVPRLLSFGLVHNVDGVDGDFALKSFLARRRAGFFV